MRLHKSLKMNKRKKTEMESVMKVTNNGIGGGGGGGGGGRGREGEEGRGGFKSEIIK